MKIFFGYKYTEKPWGGANSFIRALSEILNKEFGFQIEYDDYSSADLIFLNQVGTGPGSGSSNYSFVQLRKFINSGVPVVVRAVNLERHTNPFTKYSLRAIANDLKTIWILNHASTVIFQSEYQKQMFINFGYRGKNDVVIHNGASLDFKFSRNIRKLNNDNIRLVSSTASPRKTKMHSIISAISLIENVSVSHIGRWPADVPQNNVNFLGILNHSQIRKVMSNSDFLLHPAIKDPCPNVIFEAISVGLPVIYNPNVGSSEEIVGECGYPLNLSNLAESIAMATNCYDSLLEAVGTHNSRYGIMHAAKCYAAQFNDTVNNLKRK